MSSSVGSSPILSSLAVPLIRAAEKLTMNVAIKYHPLVSFTPEYSKKYEAVVKNLGEKFQVECHIAVWGVINVNNPHPTQDGVIRIFQMFKDDYFPNITSYDFSYVMESLDESFYALSIKFFASGLNPDTFTKAEFDEMIKSLSPFLHRGQPLLDPKKLFKNFLSQEQIRKIWERIRRLEDPAEWDRMAELDIASLGEISLAQKKLNETSVQVALIDNEIKEIEKNSGRILGEGHSVAQEMGIGFEDATASTISKGKVKFTINIDNDKLIAFRKKFEQIQLLPAKRKQFEALTRERSVQLLELEYLKKTADPTAKDDFLIPLKRDGALELSDFLRSFF